MLFQKHFILLISASFVDLLKRDLVARVGGGGRAYLYPLLHLLQTDC